MTDYSFSSTDADRYHLIRCPINFTGLASVSWYVKFIIGNCNIRVLDKDDFIIFKTDEVHEIRVDRAYFNLDSKEEGFMEWFQSKLFEINIFSWIDGGGRWSFSSKTEFEIINCSYFMKQVLGLYYIKQFPIVSIKDVHYEIQGKASGYKLGSTMWYGICNSGCNTLINNQWQCFICLRIFNTFSSNCVFQHSNKEFIASCSSVSLSNLQISIVDENLQPIRFTNPIHIFITVQASNEEQPSLKLFQPLPPNPILLEKINQKRKETYEKKEKGLINLGKYDKTADRENEDLNFPLKTPQQEESELKNIRQNISKNNPNRESIIKEIKEEYENKN